MAAIEPGLRDPDNPELGYKIIIPRDCVRGCFCPEEVEETLADLKRLCKDHVEVTTVYELIPRLE